MGQIKLPNWAISDYRNQRFLFVAAKIWRHAGRTGVSYSDHYEEKGVFERLMTRLRKIAPGAQSYASVMLPALR